MVFTQNKIKISFFFSLFLFIGNIRVVFIYAATDKYAIDISKKEDRGKINASMNIGSSPRWHQFHSFFIFNMIVIP